eukprot:TRINITY_DN59642_c0_g1_i1.p1 TRINITY_DN59642_c0_g1~~TRINITY_DN59642_c0_g1_i1.p1  ORF type:complete len:214 (+),score=23.74 TRINITY_DN59642_c0_g1_i1:122-763(+)
MIGSLLMLFPILPYAAASECAATNHSLTESNSLLQLSSNNFSTDREGKPASARLDDSIPPGNVTLSMLENRYTGELKDTQCAVFSGPKHNYYFMKCSDCAATGDSKCSSYNVWTACDSDLCGKVNSFYTSACDYNIRSFKCGSNARVKICNQATKTTMARTGHTYWSYDGCTQYDYGQDKRDISGGDDYFYFVVTSRNTDRRRRSRRRRSWFR